MFHTHEALSRMALLGIAPKVRTKKKTIKTKKKQGKISCYETIIFPCLFTFRSQKDLREPAIYH